MAVRVGGGVERAENLTVFNKALFFSSAINKPLVWSRFIIKNHLILVLSIDSGNVGFTLVPKIIYKS